MRVNNVQHVDERSLPAAMRLLDLLREQLGLTGTKEACGRGECGACTVLVDGKPALACITLARRVSGHVETIEGVADEAADLRASFADSAAFQCGFCTPGQVVRGVSLLRGGVPPDERQLREAISGNICRCTGYQGIVNAIRDTARARASVPVTHRATPAVARTEGSAQ
jgi:aerobic-type carbon monoxide dehydrogenase small subunit (CoxS/CutS family)